MVIDCVTNLVGDNTNKVLGRTRLLKGQYIMVRQPSLFKSLFYLVTKYVVFFMILAFMDNRFNNMVIDSAKNADQFSSLAFGYIFEILFTTFLLTIILIIPFHLLFKLHNMTYMLLAFAVFLVFEYFVYEKLASFIHFDINGIINGITTIVFFLLFFGKFTLSLHYIKSS